MPNHYNSYEITSRSRQTSFLDVISLLWEKITSIKMRYKIIIALLIVYTIICIPIYKMQNQLIYNPRGLPITVQQLGSGWIERKIENNGDELTLYAKIKDINLPTVIYAHGRSENIQVAKYAAQAYLQNGYNLVIPEYPGFSGTKGYPSEENTKASLDEAYSWTISQGIKADNIIIHGNSLGAGPALHIAQKPHGYLILTAPVASMDEIVSSWVPFYPSIIMFQPWDNIKAAQKAYNSKKIIFHSQDDSVVPFDHGKRLASTLKAQFKPINGSDHRLVYRGEIQTAIIAEIQKAFQNADQGKIP